MNVILVFSSIFTFAACIDVDNLKNVDKKLFDLDKEKLKEFWHLASVKGLLKAKAKDVYRRLPFTEEVVFKQCSEDAEKVGDLAHCVVRLLDARDRLEEESKMREATQTTASPIITVSSFKKHPVQEPLRKLPPLGKRINWPETPAPGLLPPRPKTDVDLIYESSKDIHYFQPEMSESKRPLPAQEYYYKTSQYQKALRKAVRPQKSSFERYFKKRRTKRDDVEALFEQFLAEQREAKKNELIRTKSRPTSSKARRPKQKGDTTRLVGNGGGKEDYIRKPTTTNFLGIPRYYRRSKSGRKSKREVPIITGDPINSSEVEKQIISLQQKEHKSLPIDVVRPQVHHSLSNKTQQAINHFNSVASKWLTKLIDHPKSPKEGNIDNLQKIKSHFRRVQKCNEYFKTINEENSNLFRQLRVPINSEKPEVSKDYTILEELLNMINNYMGTEKSKQKMSFLSPRLMSIMPEGSSSKAYQNQFLSPNLLSFHGDGFLSMKDLIKILTSNEHSQQTMLEMIMDFSGANEALEKIVKKMELEMKQMEEVQYPLVREMSLLDLGYLRAHKTFSPKQRHDWNIKGYTFYTEQQMEMITSTGSRLAPSQYFNYDEFSGKSEEDFEKMIEDDIRKIAQIARDEKYHNGTRRAKRAGPVGADGIPTFVTLHPAAFSNLINHGIAMKIATLSPHAFIGEIMSPEALVVETLSPRAFIATVLSPSALFARILSPTALRAEVLSPRALTAWVLSPEALVAEVLSPRFLEPRVLSPETLVIDVLSPGILSPHYLSSESLGVIILSPNILSPRIESEEKMLVEILSPHILGGPHSKEEKEHDVLSDAGGGSEGHSSKSESSHNGHSSHEEHDESSPHAQSVPLLVGANPIVPIQTQYTFTNGVPPINNIGIGFRSR